MQNLESFSAQIVLIVLVGVILGLDVLVCMRAPSSLGGTT
jgi:hypothetical protein